MTTHLAEFQKGFSFSQDFFFGAFRNIKLNIHYNNPHEIYFGGEKITGNLNIYLNKEFLRPPPPPLVSCETKRILL